MEKQTLFISYCWKDGNTYADELETQLAENFNVKRDKLQLIANDDIYDFMTEIANCDNVLIVLTEGYVLSTNCMLEMSYLLGQEDWSEKSMVLVIDETLYGTERKLEIINYWQIKQNRCGMEMNNTKIGNSILQEEKEYIDQICNQVENFFMGISRRKNPSQIAIVNEIIKKSQRSKEGEMNKILKGEQEVRKYIAQYGDMTISEIQEKTGRTRASTMRLVNNLIQQGKIVKIGAGRKVSFGIKNDYVV